MFEINENNEVVCGQTTRAILVGISFEEDTAASMKELEGLAEAAGAQVLGQMVQSRERPDKATYLGKGKVEELAEMCGNMEANTVIFNNELSGAQIRNLENAVGVTVLDRTILILDIFAERASSAEGRLQVELAATAVPASETCRIRQISVQNRGWNRDERSRREKAGDRPASHSVPHG